jgi:hypothetical protein
VVESLTTMAAASLERADVIESGEAQRASRLI